MFMIFCKGTQELGFHVTLSAECAPVRVCSLTLNISANQPALKGLIQAIIAAGGFRCSSLGIPALIQSAS